MTVVVACSADALGRVALEHGIVQARSRGERLLVVNATRGVAFADDQFASDEVLAEVAERLAAAGVGAEVRQEVVPDVAQGLVDAARGASLLVVGVRPRSPVGKVLLGSVTQRVLLDADVPVLAVSTPPQEAADAPLVVAYRDDPAGRSALAHGAAEASRSRRRLLLVHVGGADEAAGAEDDLLENVRRLDERGVAVELVPLRGKDVAGALQQLVADRHAGLLVLGVRHRSAVGKMLMGSVAQRLILDLDVPVVAVKAGRPRDGRGPDDMAR